jgi:hypothetical protein
MRELKNFLIVMQVLYQFHRSLKVAVQGPALWPTLIHTYIHCISLQDTSDVYTCIWPERVCVKLSVP